MKEITVNGMKCDHCRMRVENAIKSVEGVTQVKVDVATARASIEGHFAIEKVKQAIETAGYTVEI